MNNDSSTDRTDKLRRNLTLLTLVTLAGTVGIALLVSAPPRGFLFWVTVVFLLLAELLLGTVTLSTLTPSKDRDGSDGLQGAHVAIGFVPAVLFTILGLLAIVIYAFLRDENGTADFLFLGILLAVALLCLVMGGTIRSFGAHAVAQDKSIRENRVGFRDIGEGLRALKFSLTQASTSNGILQDRRSRLLKKAAALETIFSHGYARGSGTWNQEVKTDDRLNVEIDGEVAVLAGLVAELSTATEDEQPNIYDRVEASLAKLSFSAERLGIS